MIQKNVRQLFVRSDKLWSLMFIALVVLPGCSTPTIVTLDDVLIDDIDVDVYLPIDDYELRRSYKGFGEYIEDRFTGYHIGDDIEYVDVTDDVPVYAMADGTISYLDSVWGYGGLLMIEHVIDDVTYQALYGHIDLRSVPYGVGDAVVAGEKVAILGEPHEGETSGERKHLHFGLYKGTDIRFQGYASTTSEVEDWVNPSDFFDQYGLMEGYRRMFNPDDQLGGDIFNLTFELQPGWEVEYIHSLEALSLYESTGEGIARDRSQILIRYFDASSFLTLSTVEIYETTELTVGIGDYDARRYDIQKKTGVADFADQPSWRNERHIVTDFYDSEGYDRYYVVAANPDLDPDVYEEVLASMNIR